MKYIIGIDVGTGSLEAVLYDTTGMFVNSHSVSYSTQNISSGFSEQNPEDWVSAFNEAVSMLVEREGVSDNLIGIGLTGQMHTLVILNDKDEVIRPAILWNDVRNTEEVKLLSEIEMVEKKSRNKVLEGFTLPKLLWLKRNEPENWDKIAKFMLPSSYISYVTTNSHTMDYSDASGTLLIDHDSGSWNKDLFKYLDLPIESAPELFWGTQSSNEMSSEMKESLGIRSNSVKVFNGSADNSAALLATGIVDTETALLSIGTSGVFMMLEDDHSKGYNGDLHFFHHVIPNTYYSMGVTLSAGQSLSWIKSVLAPEKSFDSLLQEIEHVKPGSDGLLFAPYIMGERTPYADSKIRGAFIGLDITHTSNHLLRSVLEGITFSLKDSYQILKKHGKTVNRIISVGGGSNSDIWLQMQADVFNLPVTKLLSNQGASYGAVMIALKGLGYMDVINNMQELGKTFYPHNNSVIEYEGSYKKYTKIYKNIKKIT